MDRVAVFVDAGYLFAEGSRALCGRKLKRGSVTLDPAPTVAILKRFAQQHSGLPLLRIYWYDGTSRRPTRQQSALADHADIKLRLGSVDAAGRQNGVDTLIVTDMVNLARNRAMADCVLLSGDDDLRVAVADIQHHGVRVHVLGISPVRGTQSRLLRQEADSAHEWGAETLRTFLRSRAPPRPAVHADAARHGRGRGSPARWYCGPGTRPVSFSGTAGDVARRLAREVVLARVTYRENYRASN